MLIHLIITNIISSKTSTYFFTYGKTETKLVKSRQIKNNFKFGNFNDPSTASLLTLKNKIQNMHKMNKFTLLTLISGLLLMTAFSESNHNNSDDHSCHYGMVSDNNLGIPIVEDECSWHIESTENSYLFECVDDTYGLLYTYSDVDCDNNNEINVTIVNETNSFDCSSDATCNVYEFSRDVYCAPEDSSVKCDSDCFQLSSSLALTDGAMCVYNSKSDLYISTIVNDGFLSLRYYASSDSDCNNGAVTVYNFSNGCNLDPINNNWGDYCIGENGCSGSGSSGAIGIKNIIRQSIVVDIMHILIIGMIINYF